MGSYEEGGGIFGGDVYFPTAFVGGDKKTSRSNPNDWNYKTVNFDSDSIYI